MERKGGRLMTGGEILDNFKLAARDALGLCRGQGGGPELTLIGGRMEKRRLSDALVGAHELMVLAIGRKAQDSDPLGFSKSVLTLMEAYSSLGETTLLEDLFHALPTGSGGDA